MPFRSTATWPVTIFDNNIVVNNILGYYSRSIAITGGSIDNLVYRNNVIGPSPLMYIDVDVHHNEWNWSAPVAGNFCSDYAGHDATG